MVDSDLPRIDIIAEATFTFSGDAHRVVTFLNKALKDRNLIFGLTEDAGGAYSLRIYEVVEASQAPEQDMGPRA